MISLHPFPLCKSLFSDKNTSSWNSSPKTNFIKYFWFILTHLLHQLDRLENYTWTVLLVKSTKCWDGVAPSEQSESTTITQLRGRGLYTTPGKISRIRYIRDSLYQPDLGIQFSCSSLYQENRQNSLHS